MENYVQNWCARIKKYIAIIKKIKIEQWALPGQQNSFSTLLAIVSLIIDNNHYVVRKSWKKSHFHSFPRITQNISDVQSLYKGQKCIPDLIQTSNIWAVYLLKVKIQSGSATKEIIVFFLFSSSCWLSLILCAQARCHKSAGKQFWKTQPLGNDKVSLGCLIQCSDNCRGKHIIIALRCSYWEFLSLSLLEAVSLCDHG